MKGLIVLGTMLGGGVVGCYMGFIAALFWADMDISSLDSVGYIAGGTVAGAATGAYIGGQLVS